MIAPLLITLSIPRDHIIVKIGAVNGIPVRRAIRLRICGPMILHAFGFKTPGRLEIVEINCEQLKATWSGRTSPLRRSPED